MRPRARAGTAQGQGLPDRALRVLQRARHPARPGGARDDARAARVSREARRGRRGRRGRLPGRRAERPCASSSPRSSPSRASSCCAGTSTSTSARSSRPGDLAAEIAPVRGVDRPLADAGDRRGARGRANDSAVVARAGIGLDNVDVEAATRRGVMVVNAPQSNVISAAEHTLALLLSQARNIPQAHAALIAGRWERVEVGGRRARRQDDRRDRARPRRRAGGASRRGVRHAGDRVRPLRERRIARRRWAST